MDPNVQVALVSVFATTITTLGVVLVAVINNRKERNKAANDGAEADPDHNGVLERLLSLVDENHRKETIIINLRRSLRESRERESELRRQLKLKGDSNG